MTRIIVKGTNWIGDVFLSLPAVHSLRRIFPDAVIDVAIKRPLGELLSGVGVVNTVLDYNGTIHGEFDLIRDIRRGRYDIGVIFPRSLHSAVLVFLGGVPERIGYAADGRSLLLTRRVARTPEIRAVHQSGYYRHLVSVLGDPGPLVVPRIEPGPADAAWADMFLKGQGYTGGPLIGINPGAAYGNAKRWRPERFGAVADRLVGDLGGAAVIFGGGQDREIEDETARSMKSSPIRAAGRTTISRLIALIARCSLFITNDSGPMHIAAALSVPITAVFGPTNPVTTSPMGSSAIVRHEFDCSGCLLRSCPIDRRCMESITSEEVYEAARRVLLGIDQEAR